MSLGHIRSCDELIDSPIKRRLSRQIRVGSVPIGGNAPIAVQSMTNTNTCNASATVEQIEAIVDAGADLVRVSVPTMEAADAFGKIRRSVSVPLVADIHFDHKIALKVINLGVDCLRINPEILEEKTGCERLYHRVWIRVFRYVLV